MFRIECFCDDKKLGDVQRVLHGLILQAPNVQYVANAAVVDGKVVAKTKAGNLMELVLAHFANMQSFNRDDVRSFLSENGFSEGTAGYITQKLREQKLIRSIKGKRGLYEKIKPAAKK